MLDAAIAEFTSAGYDGASVDAIAALAEVSKRTLYNHFESKEGLFQALVEEVVRRLQLSMTIRYAADRPLRDQLAEFAQHAQRLNSDPENVRLLRAVLAEHIRCPERVEPILQKFWRTEYGFASWVRAAHADGRLRGDPSRMSHVMGSLIRALMFWPAVLGRNRARAALLHEDVAEAIDMFLC